MDELISSTPAVQGAVAQTVDALLQACAHICEAKGEDAWILLERTLSACPSVAAWWGHGATAAVEGGGGHGIPVVREEEDQDDQAARCLVTLTVVGQCAEAGRPQELGVVFAVWSHPRPGMPVQAGDFLQAGDQMQAAGYLLLGRGAVLAVSMGSGVSLLELEGCAWGVSHAAWRSPQDGGEIAVNASRQRFWDKALQRYVAECLAGEGGARLRDFGLHWAGHAVADAHRVLVCGGVLLAPQWTEPGEGLKLANTGPDRVAENRGWSLLALAAPLAWLVVQAGGHASTGTGPLLELQPEQIDQEVAVFLGERAEVERVARYHSDPLENMPWQLFKTRSLFVQPQV